MTPQQLAVGQIVDENGNPVASAPPAQAPATPALQVGQIVDENGNPVGTTSGRSGFTTAGNVARGIGQTTFGPIWDTLKLAAQSGGDPFKLVTDMGANLGRAQWDQLVKAAHSIEDAYHTAKGGAPLTSPAVLGDTASAFGHGLAGVIPVAGPALANVAEKVGSGDPNQQEEAVGNVLGLGGSAMAGEAIPAGMNRASALYAARQAARTPTALVTADLFKGIPPSPTGAAAYNAVDVQNSMPHLAMEQAASPMETTQAIHDGLESGVTQIEQHIHGILTDPRFEKYQIQSNALQNAQRALSPPGAMGAHVSDVPTGMEAVQGFGLDKPMTLLQLDDLRLRLNAVNKNILASKGTDIAAEMNSDPAFAARQNVVDTIRNELYDTLVKEGVPGIADLRRDEGSMIKIRNASYRQLGPKGDTYVTGTGATGNLATVARKVIPAATAGTTALIAGKLGGDMATDLGATTLGYAGGQILSDALLPNRMTRNQLVARAMSRMGPQTPPTFSPVPPPSPVAGLLSPPARPMGGMIGTPTPGITPQPFNRAPALPGQLMDASGVMAVPASIAQTHPTLAIRMGRLLGAAPEAPAQPIRLGGDVPGPPFPVIGGTSQPTVFSREQLTAGHPFRGAQGELGTDEAGVTRLAPAPSGPMTVPAKSLIVRGPDGRFKRVWLGEAADEAPKGTVKIDVSKFGGSQ